MVKSFKIVAVLVISTLLASVLSAAPGSDVAQCAFKPDFVPDAVRKCMKNVPISCKGTTVCYKYTDTLTTIPCILDAYGFSGFIKMHKCGNEIQYTVNPGMVVCIEEDQLRKFYSCFDE